MKTKDFKGTKGDWKMMVGGFTTRGEIPNMIQIYATNEDLEMVCKVYKDELLHEREQCFEANALLISKAPEMLELLKGIYDSMHFLNSNNMHITRNKIGKLIKEATEITKI